MTDLVWTPVKIKLGKIRPWEANPRMSTKAQAQRLIKSERELGQIQTLAVSPADDAGFVNLYDGHQRCSAWMTVKPSDYEVLALQSNRHLSEDERRKVSVLLHMATGSWDWNALSSWSAADLGEWGMDADALKGWNNDALNLRTMITAEIDEETAFGGLPTEDRAPFQQMTFTLHDEQSETVREAMKLAKAQGAFIDSPNENSNGNALARICETYITEHGNC